MVIEKEETLVSPLVIKRRIDQAFQNVEDILTKHDQAFTKVKRRRVLLFFYIFHALIFFLFCFDRIQKR